MENITKEQFNSYEDVRLSGVTNMFDVKTVSNLSGLDRATILIIMDKYAEIKKKFEG